MPLPDTREPATAPVATASPAVVVQATDFRESRDDLPSAVAVAAGVAAETTEPKRPPKLSFSTPADSAVTEPTRPSKLSFSLSIDTSATKADAEGADEQKEAEDDDAFNQ